MVKILFIYLFIYLFISPLLFSMLTLESIRKIKVKNARNNKENLLIAAEVCLINETNKASALSLE